MSRVVRAASVSCTVPIFVTFRRRSLQHEARSRQNIHSLGLTAVVCCFSSSMTKSNSPFSRWPFLHAVWLILVLSIPSACSQSDVKSALLVVDMQGCFLPGGPLAVSGDIRPVIEAINGLKQHGGFDRVVWTQDWHPPNHVSFASMHSKQPQDSLQLSYTCVGNRWVGKGPRLCDMTYLYPDPEQSINCVSHHTDDTLSQDCSSSSSSGGGGGGITGAAVEAGLCIAAAAEALAERIRRFGCPEPVTVVQQVLWPEHCVRHTAGAQIHPDFQISAGDLIVRKGWQPFIDAYSAFEDNGKLQSTGLAEQLRAEGIGRVVVTGVALDFCVLWTALDAVGEGFETFFVLDASLPVSAAGGADAVQQMRAAGVKVVEKAQMLHTAANKVTEQTKWY